MNACNMLRKGCVGYWCYVLEVKEEEVRVEDIHVLWSSLMYFQKSCQGYHHNEKLI